MAENARSQRSTDLARENTVKGTRGRLCGGLARQARAQIMGARSQPDRLTRRRARGNTLGGGIGVRCLRHAASVLRGVGRSGSGSHGTIARPIASVWPRAARPNAGAGRYHSVNERRRDDKRAPRCECDTAVGPNLHSALDRRSAAAADCRLRARDPIGVDVAARRGHRKRRRGLRATGR